VHLRAPSVDKGVSAFLWALFFFLYLFFGSVAVGVDKGPALILSALAGFGAFLFIRILGDRAPRPPDGYPLQSASRPRREAESAPTSSRAR
jgi:hypothetical protein